MSGFIDSVSDRIIEYLTDNRTWDMREVRNIISLHFSQGMEKILRSEEAELAAEQEKLIAEQRKCYTSSRRNAEINAELLKLSRKRKAIRMRVGQAQDESELALLKKYLRQNDPELLERFYTTIPKRQRFAKI
ncbi:MAG: hypothetical protein IKY66_03390 [Bacteroidales bacterium]|nr:hypothetical protein [Bacteroidales bacterium]